jgi:hypothetical protein
MANAYDIRNGVMHLLPHCLMYTRCTSQTRQLLDSVTECLLPRASHICQGIAYTLLRNTRGSRHHANAGVRTGTAPCVNVCQHVQQRLNCTFVYSLTATHGLQLCCHMVPPPVIKGATVSHLTFTGDPMAHHTRATPPVVFKPVPL